MSDIFQLFRVQQIDSQIDDLQSQIAANNERISDSSEIASAEVLLNALYHALEETQHQLLSVEKEVGTCKLKFSQNQTALYGGKVRSPKELQDLQLEANAIQNHIAALEDTQLTWMFKVEEINGEYTQSLEKLNQIKSQKELLTMDLEKHNLDALNKIEALTRERNSIITGVSKIIMDQYETLRKKKGGIAVSRIATNACSACGATLNSTLIQNARSSTQLVFCNTCNRMLYYG